MLYAHIYFLITNFILIVDIISSNKQNLSICKKFLSFSFIAKIKIKERGYQNIIYPYIRNFDNQKYPDEILIEKNNEIINIARLTYRINSEEDENIVIMKWNEYPNSTRLMFFNCINITEIDLTQFDLAYITIMDNTFQNCYNLTSVKFGNYDTSSLIYISKMFFSCSGIISIDLSMFDTSNVIDMSYLFYGCSSLISLNLSNFKTSKVENMRNMFDGMYSLKSLDIHNFDTKNVKSLTSMFKNCFSLIHLDLSNFETSKFENINDMFDSCGNLEFLNLSNWGSDNLINMAYLFRECHSLKEIDLSNFITSNVTQMNAMFYNCYSLTSLDLSSFDTSQVFNVGHMFYGCKSLISLKITHFNTSNFQYIDNMFNGCSSLISLDISNLQSKNIKKSQNMFEGCNNLSYINMLNFIEFNNDTTIYKNLFNNIKSNIIICIQDNNSPIISNLVNEIGCATIYCGEDLFRVKKNFDLYMNTCKLDCPEDYPFELVSKKECVENCQIESILNEECLLNFEENEDDINGKKIESTKLRDIMLKNTEISFTSEEYNTSNLDNGNEEIIKDEKMKITLTTTKAQKFNYDNNIINMTTIDIGNCETLLREENGIPSDELLYMKKIEVNQDQMKIPKVEFEIYYKENNKKLKKLNLTICENSDMHLSYPVDISENEDIYNPKSDYYNNICFPTTSNRGTDIILRDRQIEFIEGNKAICQDGCNFEKYDYINKRSQCICKGKEFKPNINSIADIKINKKKLFENFIDINNIANIQLMKCYELLFSKEGIINNIAFYLIIPIIIFHFISICIFSIYQKKEIYNKINDITYAINNRHLMSNKKKKNQILRNKNEENNKNEIESLDENKNIIKKEEELIKQDKKSLSLINSNIIEGNIFIKNNIINNDINNNINNDYIINNIYNINSDKDNKPQKNEEQLKNIKLSSPYDFHCITNVFHKKEENYNPPIKRKKLKKNKSNNKINNVKETENLYHNVLNNENNEDIVKKIKIILEYNDKERNEFTYKKALKYDKRNYCQFYFSLLKTKYILIFTFYTSNDYNSKIIKINLFLISFVANYAINALFFSDDTMHKIYEDYGKFDIINQLPEIIYSYLISTSYDFLLNLLALSEDDITEFKKIRKKVNLISKAKSLKNKLDIKFLFYFIISLIFLLSFWYYLAMFCAVYKNTQYHLIKDTLISFGLSFITPLGFNLLPGICRIPSLSDKKNKLKYLYRFSQYLQLF